MVANFGTACAWVLDAVGASRSSTTPSMAAGASGVKIWNLLELRAAASREILLSELLF